jgi:hypothetical protein
VEAEKLIFDDGSERQVVEKLSQALPDVWITVFAATLIVKTINLRDLPRFVVPPQDSDPVLVAHLQRDQQRDRLNRVVAWMAISVPLST